MVCIYYCSLVSATLLGVGRQGGCSSHLSPDNNVTFGFFQFFYFYKVYINTLDACFWWLLIRVLYGHSLEGSALILRVLLIFWCLKRFWRGFQSGQVLFGGFYLTGNFRASCWGFTSGRSSWQSPLFPSGWSFSPLLSGGFLLAIAFPKRFPGLLGILNCQRYLSVPEINAMESLLPVFLSCCSETKKFSWDLFPDLSRSYFGDCISSSLCRLGKN